VYDSVIETIRSYVLFADWEVQFIIVTSSGFVEVWYEKYIGLNDFFGNRVL